MDGHDLPSDTPRVLFVNHSSRTGGAEFILLANLRAFGANSSVWLFEDGPLKTALADHPPRVLMPSRPSGFTDIKRDQGMARAALPMLGGMLRMVREIAAAAAHPETAERAGTHHRPRRGRRARARSGPSRGMR